MRRLIAGLRDTEAAARFLLGKTLVRRLRGVENRARIVETEAYLGLKDPASHAFRGPTLRNAPLWQRPGTLYVYLIYGMHYCLNVACEPEGTPGCVLIRAAEPLDGGSGTREMSGPGRLCRALGIDAALNGRHLFEPGASLTLRDGAPPSRIGVSTRIGIAAAADWQLRFFDADSAAVSSWRAPAMRRQSVRR